VSDDAQQKPQQGSNDANGQGAETRPAPQPARNSQQAKQPAGAKPDEAPDRSAASFSPIVSSRHLRRFEALVRRRPVKANVGIVLVTQSGDCYGYPPDRQPTVGELLWKGAGTVYEVDMGIHWSNVKLEVPSQTEAFFFDATIELEWWVTDPVPIVKRGVYDVRKALEPHLWQRLSAITRSFEVEDSADAENTAAESLTKLPVGAEYGLGTRAFLKLRMDTPTVRHVSAVRDIRRDMEIERETQLLRLLRDDSTTTLIDRRVTRYRRILLSGDFDQFALQLAQNPDEAPAVIQMLREERHNNRRAVTDFVTSLLDSGAIDRHEINDQVREALRWLKDATDTVLKGPDPAGRATAQRVDALPSVEIPPSDLPEPPTPSPPGTP
jgi:hypothetical protein